MISGPEALLRNQNYDFACGIKTAKYERQVRDSHEARTAGPALSNAPTRVVYVGMCLARTGNIQCYAKVLPEIGLPGRFGGFPD